LKKKGCNLQSDHSEGWEIDQSVKQNEKIKKNQLNEWNMSRWWINMRVGLWVLCWESGGEELIKLDTWWWREI
jgi:hypothetical protein